MKIGRLTILLYKSEAKRYFPSFKWKKSYIALSIHLASYTFRLDYNRFRRVYAIKGGKRIYSPSSRG